MRINFPSHLTSRASGRLSRISSYRAKHPPRPAPEIRDKTRAVYHAIVVVAHARDRCAADPGRRLGDAPAGEPRHLHSCLWRRRGREQTALGRPLVSCVLLPYFPSRTLPPLPVAAATQPAFGSGGGAVHRKCSPHRAQRTGLTASQRCRSAPPAQTYKSPLRQHKRTPSQHREVKVRLLARRTPTALAAQAVHLLTHGGATLQGNTQCHHAVHQR